MFFSPSLRFSNILRNVGLRVGSVSPDPGYRLSRFENGLIPDTSRVPGFGNEGVVLCFLKQKNAP